MITTTNNPCGAYVVMGILEESDLDTEVHIKNWMTGRIICSGKTAKEALEKAALRYVNMAHANLSGLDLRGANLRGAKLFRALIHNTDLRDADLREARMHSAAIRYCQIGVADFKGTDLTCAMIDDTFLADTNTETAILVGTKFGHND